MIIDLNRYIADCNCPHRQQRLYRALRECEPRANVSLLDINRVNDEAQLDADIANILSHQGLNSQIELFAVFSADIALNTCKDKFDSDKIVNILDAVKRHFAAEGSLQSRIEISLLSRGVDNANTFPEKTGLLGYAELCITKSIHELLIYSNNHFNGSLVKSIEYSRNCVGESDGSFNYMAYATKTNDELHRIIECADKATALNNDQSQEQTT